jgi:hypothetical protein
MRLFVLAALCSGIFSFSIAHASVNLIDANNWKIDMSGFAETDVIHDSRRSFSEKIGNSPVGRPDSVDGQNGKTQFSIRNSRLAFNVQAPLIEEWKTRAYYEFDLLGYDPTPGPNNSEAAFYNNPTMRTRHLYANAEKGGWQFLTGQTWAMLGWQPTYFMPTIQVSPIPGMLYSRTTQLRAVKTFEGDTQTWQFAAGIMRPPQRDGNLPSLEAGARWTLNTWRAAFTGGATGGHKPQPASVGISGTLRNFEAPSNPYATPQTSATTKLTGSAVAIDFLAPILPSKDGKSFGNNLIVGGEFTIGKGYGDQLDGWTGNENNPLNAVNNKAPMVNTPDANMNIDAGIGGFDGQNFGLINLQTWNIYAQYHLPEAMRMWVSVGYSELYSNNMTAFNINNGSKVSYNREQALFANVNHDFTDQFRAGLEYAHIKTGYTDGINAEDSRVQFSSWFIF